MLYNFDEVIDRRHAKYSYSMKWASSPQVAKMVGVDAITDDSIAVFTADMDFRCAPSIIEALHGVVDHGIFGYSVSPKEYYDAVIHWFSHRHNWTILPEEIVYVDGTVEAMKQIILAFTNPGDGVIIQRPIYGPFSSSIENNHREIVNNQLIANESGYYTIDFADLEEKCKNPNNKLLILCNPHNPVGRIWSDEELIRLSEICSKNNVLIAADEIHGDLIRVGETFHPIATLVDNSNIITATAVNKTFNLAGLHCTNLIINNPDLREQFTRSFGFNLPSPFTIAAVIAAYRCSEDWLEELRKYLDGTIDWVLAFLHERMPGVKCRRPEGTYILWMDFRSYGLSSEEIHNRIYNKAGVLLEGGDMFDPANGAGFERICLPSPRSVIQEVFERIAAEFEETDENVSF